MQGGVPIPVRPEAASFDKLRMNGNGDASEV